MSDAPEQSKWAEKLAERRESYKERGRLYRLLFIITGAIVTLCGLAMVVLPGPALVVIPIGLAMLAMEFAWAETMLERALTQAEKASKTVSATSRRQKLFGVIAIALGIAALVVAAILWDVPKLPI